MCLRQKNLSQTQLARSRLEITDKITKCGILIHVAKMNTFFLDLCEQWINQNLVYSRLGDLIFEYETPSIPLSGLHLVDNFGEGVAIW
jgi:hypothetical protein